MAKVSKKQLHNTQNTRKFSSEYYIDFLDHLGNARSVRYGKGRKNCEDAGRIIEKLVVLKKENDYPDSELTAWIKDSPPQVQGALISSGIITQPKNQAVVPLASHIAAWKDALLSQGCSSASAEQHTSHALSVFRMAGMRMWDDISLDRIRKVLSGRNIFKYIKNRHECAESLVRFAHWMRESNRAFNLPLRDLDRIMAKVPPNNGGRVIPSQDFSRFVHSAMQDDAIVGGLDGPTRAALYVVVNQTGLSWAGIGALRIGMFDRNIPAIASKLRRQNVVRDEEYPLTRSATAILEAYLDTRTSNPMAKMFYLPKRSMTLEMIKHDLGRIGLPYMDDEGYVFDILSLKKCCKNWIFITE